MVIPRADMPLQITRVCSPENFHCSHSGHRADFSVPCEDRSLPPTPSHPNQTSSFKSASASTEIVASLLQTEKKRKRDRSPSTESYSSSSAESDTSTTTTSSSSPSSSSSSYSSSSSSSSSPTAQTSKLTQVRSESRNVVSTRTPTRYDKRYFIYFSVYQHHRQRERSTPSCTSRSG